MFLIDRPYASEYLKETIKKNDYRIIDTKDARALINDNDFNWIDEKKAISLIKNDPSIPVYSNSENALSWLEQHLPEQEVTRNILLFKDKFHFRESIKEIFPDFFFELVLLSELETLDIEKLPLPVVIKPKIGFFSIGVHIIRNREDWLNAKQQLQIEKLRSIFPPNVLNTSSFIIEEFIEGEEFAVDYYYNNVGKAIVLNLLHHTFSSGTDTSDRVYTTSKEIIEKHRENVQEFLTRVGQKMKLKNFPAHAELRIDGNGKIVPIEINPLRFGGWCTTGDLLGVTLGFNSYVCFQQKEEPDWNSIFKGKENKLFSLIVLDNNSGLQASEIDSFDYKKLSADFECAVQIRKLDIQEYPVFGFVFAETDPHNQQELERILVSDLRKYIKLKAPVG